MASRTESEIWSDTLSGCPSDTDSEVNRKSLFIGSPHGRSARHFIKDRAPQAGSRLKFLLRPLARLPLGANHALGAFLGRLVFLLSRRYRARVIENLTQSGLCRSPDDVRRLARENAAEIGKGATELVWSLFRPIDEVAGNGRARGGGGA